MWVFENGKTNTGVDPNKGFDNLNKRRK